MSDKEVIMRLGIFAGFLTNFALGLTVFGIVGFIFSEHTVSSVMFFCSTPILAIAMKLLVQKWAKDFQKEDLGINSKRFITGIAGEVNLLWKEKQVLQECR